MRRTMAVKELVRFTVDPVVADAVAAGTMCVAATVATCGTMFTSFSTVSKTHIWPCRRLCEYPQYGGHGGDTSTCTVTASFVFPGGT
jgi:hypothetical protein